MSEPREGWLAAQFREWSERADRLRGLGFHVTGSMHSMYTKDAAEPMVSTTTFTLELDSERVEYAPE